MADETPANWYPDATGTIRWWDGRQWTEHVREEQPEVPAYMRKPSGEIAGRRYDGDVDDEDDDDDNATRRVWLTATFVGLLAFFLGMGIGGRGEPATPTVTATAAPTPFATPTPDPELERLRQDLDQRAQELDDREQELEERASATPTPTPTPAVDEDEDRIADDGTYEVGMDFPEGTYTTAGSSDDLDRCSYTVSNDDLAEDVVDEDSSRGSMTIALSDGQYFTTENCDPWQRN
jgi:hypothetical protein